MGAINLKVFHGFLWVFDYNSPLVKMVPKDTTGEQRENSKHQLREQHDYRVICLISKPFILSVQNLADREQRYLICFDYEQLLH